MSTHEPFDIDVIDWIDEGPSRRLRKAYAALETLDAEIERVRQSNPVPDHAPSSCVAIRQRLRPLLRARDRAQTRVARLQERWFPA